MKKFAVVICISMCMLCAQSLAAKYYCSDGDWYSINNIYNPSGNCDTWDSDFWKEHSPNAYKECLDNRKVLKQKYDTGKCKPIITKTHTVGSGKCEVELVSGTNTVVSTACYNAPADAMDKIRAMYKK